MWFHRKTPSFLRRHLDALESPSGASRSLRLCHRLLVSTLQPPCTLLGSEALSLTSGDGRSRRGDTCVHQQALCLALGTVNQVGPVCPELTDPPTGRK